MKKLLSFVLSMLCASAVLAEPPPAQRATALIQKQLVQPLKQSESKRKSFSRNTPPKERRVRILDQVALTDARGQRFVRFAIDNQYRGAEPDEWHEDAVLGCAYLDEKKVFIQSGDEYFPARVMLGGDEQAQPNVCEPSGDVA